MPYLIKIHDDDDDFFHLILSRERLLLFTFKYCLSSYH